MCQLVRDDEECSSEVVDETIRIVVNIVGFGDSGG